jgi:hypothetical protein
MRLYVLRRYDFRGTRRRQMVHVIKGLNHWLVQLQQDVISTTAVHLPHRVLEVRRTETTSALQLEVRTSCRTFL